jgi:hypothetical protein
MTRHRLVWRWRRWRAAHYEWAAWLNYYRWPDPANRDRLEQARKYLRRITLDKPW